MPKAKKPKDTVSPLSANGAPSTRATRAATRAAAPRAEPKTRYYKTCEKPMKGHPKGQCGANTRSALDARAAEKEEAVLSAHTDLVSRQIDAVVADELEASEGVVDAAAIHAALAAKGLELPEGKTLADYVPDLNAVDSDAEDDDEVSTPPPGNTETPPPIDNVPGGGSAGASLESGMQPDIMQVDGTPDSAAGENAVPPKDMPVLMTSDRHGCTRHPFRPAVAGLRTRTASAGAGCFSNPYPHATGRVSHPKRSGSGYRDG
ncbi:hypothetical protein AURDEDRAFT_170855 [Auricularia subglabra TFB-10046 SS5]|nr:hypothetical protein AURDEDRAFT_170855 [Auricularia subglabra TFB-10046 SS5]